MIRRHIALGLLLCLLASPHLLAASAADLIGHWSVDGDATWKRIQLTPAIASKLSGLAPEMIDQINSVMLTQVAGTSFQFTSDTLISISNGVRREEHYSIASISGATITTDTLDDQGKASKSTVTVGKDVLEIANAADPTQVVVLKRAK